MKINTAYLKQKMEDQNIDVSDLARLANKKESWIYSILNGKGGKTFMTVNVLAKALNINPKDLVEF